MYLIVQIPAARHLCRSLRMCHPCPVLSGDIGWGPVRTCGSFWLRSGPPAATFSEGGSRLGDRDPCSTPCARPGGPDLLPRPYPHTWCAQGVTAPGDEVHRPAKCPRFTYSTPLLLSSPHGFPPQTPANADAFRPPLEPKTQHDAHIPAPQSPPSLGLGDLSRSAAGSFPFCAAGRWVLAGATSVPRPGYSPGAAVVRSLDALAAPPSPWWVAVCPGGIPEAGLPLRAAVLLVARPPSHRSRAPADRGPVSLNREVTESLGIVLHAWLGSLSVICSVLTDRTRSHCSSAGCSVSPLARCRARIERTSFSGALQLKTAAGSGAQAAWPDLATGQQQVWLLEMRRGAWVAQLVKHPTLDFGSGHDLAVREFEPRVGLCADSSESEACFRFCVSLSLCSPPAHTLSLSLSLSKINKH
uniref:uncharacterized protein LOC132692753 n=1 Tax=Panthera onca TaxID=9690 RepID=UPI0029536BC5|nr:uncharacterized protein LOC132692753 [Panthera onca]